MHEKPAYHGAGFSAKKKIDDGEIK